MLNFLKKHPPPPGFGKTRKSEKNSNKHKISATKCFFWDLTSEKKTFFNLFFWKNNNFCILTAIQEFCFMIFLYNFFTFFHGFMGKMLKHRKKKCFGNTFEKNVSFRYFPSFISATCGNIFIYILTTELEAKKSNYLSIKYSIFRLSSVFFVFFILKIMWMSALCKSLEGNLFFFQYKNWWNCIYMKET